MGAEMKTSSKLGLEAHLAGVEIRRKGGSAPETVDATLEGMARSMDAFFARQTE